MLSRLAWLGILVVFSAWGQSLLVHGRITSETGTAVPGARVTLRGAEGSVYAISDPTGAFEVTVPAAGEYEVEADREGFFRLTGQKIRIDEQDRDLELTLNRFRELTEAVDVTANPGAVDMDRTTPKVVLSGNDLMNVPYPSTNTLRNALRIMPGMVQDGRGGVHLYGAAEEQTLYTLEGFQINDPLTGKFETRMSVESVGSLSTTGARPGAEYGKGSAGVLAISSRTGDDKFRYSATNFVPGLESQKGLIIGGWTPRGNISGPWKRGRAWFSDSMDAQYTNTVVPELPSGEDRTSAWRFSNLLHNQINLTPSNILTVGSLMNLWLAPRTGLSVLDPPETTVDRRSRQWITYVKDQVYFSRGALLEVGYANNRVFAREIPQGNDVYVVTPFGKRGNYFLDAKRRAGRDQWMANLYIPGFEWLGHHQFKAGVDFVHIHYAQDARRSGIEFATLDFVPVRRTIYAGNGSVYNSNFETASYLQDSWRVRTNLLLEVGIRQDWDRLLRNWNFSPRLGFAWMPFGLDGTKLFGGFGRIFDQTNLRVISRPLDQYSLNTYYDATGNAVRGPSLSVYRSVNPHLASPRFHNWNAGFEHMFPKSVQTSLSFIHRRGSRGFTYVNRLACQCMDLPVEFDGLVNPSWDAVYALTSDRRDSYDAVEVSARQPIKGQYEWMASYTWSRARSNAVVDQSVDEPLLAGDNSGAMPWDTPHRLMSWGYLPVPVKEWAVSYLAEWRSGFPYSVIDRGGSVVGEVNSMRYGAFFELNLMLERKLTFMKNRWAVRFGFINITNHKNPNVVNNVIGSPDFLRTYGGQSRAFNIRVRWLGKK